MKKIGTIVMFAALAVVVTAMTGDATAHARLHDIDQSGIQANVFFVDNGSTLWVLGVAEGLDPTKSYISLVYGTGSAPGGPHACEPSATHPITGAQMFVGTWTVDPDGSGVLSSKKTGASYVPAAAAGTMSVRQIVAVGLPQLRACGEVAVNPL
jgi:hypothetical protein